MTDAAPLGTVTPSGGAGTPPSPAPPVPVSGPLHASASAGCHPPARRNPVVVSTAGSPARCAGSALGGDAP